MRHLKHTPDSRHYMTVAWINIVGLWLAPEPYQAVFFTMVGSIMVLFSVTSARWVE